MRDVTNSDDVIDSRDVIEMIDQLEGEEDLDEGQKETLNALKKLAEECEGYSDWKHGETLIRDSYFKEYAQELAEDIGAIKADAGWPYTCIDWDQAATELQQDYTMVDFDGVDYWIRSC